MNALVYPGHFAYRKRLAKNFKVDDPVVVHSMPPGNELEGATGVIVGKSSDHIAAFYIVLLDRRSSNGDRAVLMIESCLDHPTIEAQVI